jgi:hypothetical protein
LHEIQSNILLPGTYINNLGVKENEEERWDEKARIK